MSSRTPVDPDWPPGTVLVEDLYQENTGVVLQPPPSSDPNDPLTWPVWRKHLNFGLVSFYVLMVISFTNIATVTWGPVNAELGFSYSILNNSYAAGCGAFAVGGLLFIHFALKYGRRPVYLFSTAIQCGLSVWSARMQTVADLMLVNIFNSLVGALSEIIVQMTVADLYFVHQRGLVNSIYIWCMTIGVSLAPLAAGYVTNSQGWRWVWWWMTILFGVGVVAFFFLYEETMYIPRADETVERGADKPETSQIEISLRTRVQVDPSIPVKSYWQKLALWTSSPASLRHLARHIYQPFLIMVRIPAVFYMSLMYGAMTAAVTVPTATFSTYMTMAPYHFTSAQVGLMGLPSFIGITISVLLSGPLSDWFILRMAKRNGGIYEPETRLWIILLFAPFAPAGLLMVGIGLNNHLPWPVIAFGLGLTTFGTTTGNSIPLTYLTDAYTDIVADSLVAVTFVRNAVSAMFVFALMPWIHRDGLTKVYIIFSIVIGLILAGNLIFILWGKRFRVRFADQYFQYAERRLA